MSQPHYRTCNLCEAMCGVVITTEPSLDGESEVIAAINANPNKFNPSHSKATTMTRLAKAIFVLKPLV